ncbi:MAG TPA: NUDIX hydrolase [Candidatus Omnitrophota bacterium]|nr:NUDIX hydrolase [Candidatus Omnitrophota bacterium]HPN88386.1 NUDIX hydrolase [Candidatus Omnitrophota bacterium]
MRHLQEDLGLDPFVCVDIIIELKQGIVIIERSNPPYGWALPGGFLDWGESLEDAAKREAKEETHLELKNLRQFHTYSQMGRDPRFQTISTIFIAEGVGTPKSGDDAQDLKVIPYEELLNHRYAFDHHQVLADYLRARKSGGYYVS